jgi:hypothetical protein
LKKAKADMGEVVLVMAEVSPLESIHSETIAIE